METKTYQIYKYNELTEEQQTTVLENYRDINTHEDWWEPIYEDISIPGYSNIDVNFSGFWSQGDGASLTATIDLCAWLKSKQLANQYRALYNAAKKGDVNAEIIRNSSRYSHEHTISASVNAEADVYLYEDVVENLLTEDARNESRKIYKQLEAYYNELTSDDAIVDTLLANDYNFTAAGKID